ncbi:MAG: alanine--tRNA ligase [Spirochaetia bacterium]
MINAQKLRTMFIDFFLSKGHREISGRSVVPENDPTVLFTTAGMHPLVPYLLGTPHPSGTRLVNVQKCIRTGDIESVGDAHHLTFFEMLGNWSLGDYFKEEMIPYSYEFITSPKYLGLKIQDVYITIFAGDAGVPRDTQSQDLWQACGVPEDHIFALGREDNWWGPAGKTGPCGPDSEMFLDTHKNACGSQCAPGCSCGKYIEFWNDVFMQYNKLEDGSYVPLESKNIDTGMGVERVLALLQGKKSVYETELFIPLLTKISALSSIDYPHDNTPVSMAFRVIADHVKTATMILGDEKIIRPSNVGQGYILRRLIRRAVRMGRKLGLEGPFLGTLSQVVISMYIQPYPELENKKDHIFSELQIEEELFGKTLQQGEKEFEKLLPGLLKNPQKIVSGRVAFRLYDTFGFPLELTQELAVEAGLSVNKEEFDQAFAKHQELSKQGAEKGFKGGLADNSVMSTRYHTATHLLNAALRKVLGDHVCQQGSNITAERMRFDFAHAEPMTKEEVETVENLVNEKIAQNIAVTMKTMKLEEAKKLGAQAMFEGKYDEEVKVYFIDNFSIELCGGPHVHRTGELGQFKIQKEQSSSRGVRRIRAVLENN